MQTYYISFDSYWSWLHFGYNRWWLSRYMPYMIFSFILRDPLSDRCAHVMKKRLEIWNSQTQPYIQFCREKNSLQHAIDLIFPVFDLTKRGTQKYETCHFSIFYRKNCQFYQNICILLFSKHLLWLAVKRFEYSLMN